LKTDELEKLVRIMKEEHDAVLEEEIGIFDMKYDIMLLKFFGFCELLPTSKFIFMNINLEDENSGLVVKNFLSKHEYGKVAILNGTSEFEGF
jgi:hypothetical protein